MTNRPRGWPANSVGLSLFQSRLGMGCVCVLDEGHASVDHTFDIEGEFERVQKS